MARETRAASRTDRTPISTATKRKGMNRTRRVSTTGAGPGGEITVTVPPRADCMVIENVGSTEIRFVFGTDAFSHHWSIPAGTQSPAFAVNKNTELKVRSVSGSGDIQYMFWG